jgi:hypothetical protein
MKSAFGQAIICLSIISGCTHTTALYLNQQDTLFVRTVAKIQKLTHEDEADILLVSGERIKGREINVGADSTSWVAPDSLEMKRVSTSDVVSVSQVDRLQGAGEGAGVGFLIGGAIGGGLYLAGKQFGNGSVGDMDYTGLAIAGAAIGGSLIGLLNGVFRGSHDEFIFKKKE